MLAVVRNNDGYKKAREVLQEHGLEYRVMTESGYSVIGVVGPSNGTYDSAFAALQAIEEVALVEKVSKGNRASINTTGGIHTSVNLGNMQVIGPGSPGLIVGQCSLDEIGHVTQTLEAIADINEEHPGTIKAVRMMIWKPRTMGGDWTGIGIGPLAEEMYIKAKEITGLPLLAEIDESSQIQPYLDLGVDIFHVGARNGLNQTLLHNLAQTDNPVVVKNPHGRLSLKDYLGALSWATFRGEKDALGKQDVLPCYRGVQASPLSGERNELKYDIVQFLTEHVHLPVLVDVSHQGMREKVTYHGKRAFENGAAGLLVECHPCPDKAKTDGKQALYVHGDAKDPASLRGFVDEMLPYIHGKKE